MGRQHACSGGSQMEHGKTRLGSIAFKLQLPLRRLLVSWRRLPPTLLVTQM